MIISASLNTSCIDFECNDKGILQVENLSSDIIQTLKINGEGIQIVQKLNPGDKVIIELHKGWYLCSLSGSVDGTGCDPTIVVIREYSIQYLQCSGK